MNYSDLAPILAIDAPGAPNPLIVRQIAEAAHEFYRLTRAYQVTQAVDPIPADTKDVALVAPGGTVWVETEEVNLDGRPIFPPVNLVLPTGWKEMTGQPDCYVPAAASIRLVPYPIQAVDQELEIKFSVTPLITATSVTDEPGLRHQPALLAGARARLLAMNKPWRDPASARDAEAEFRKLINEHRVLARNRGSSKTTFRVKSRFV